MNVITKNNLPEDFYKFINNNTLIEIRCGNNRENFTKIWIVEINNRVFSRSWNKNAGGWMNCFLTNESGEIKYGERILEVKAQKIEKTDAINTAISNAYLEKYTQEHNVEYAKGISQPEYFDYTIEFVAI